MSRTTRHKILQQRDLIMHQFDRIMEHLQAIEDLADKRSRFITEIMPYAVVLVDRCRDGMRDILSKL